MRHDGIVFTLGDAIRQRRQALGLSQKMFAAKAGVNYQTVGAVERGETQNPTTLGRMCDALGVDMRELLREITVIHVAGDRSFVPAVGQLTRRLMELNGVTVDELAERIGRSIDEVESELLGGNCGAQWWGAAAMIFQVPLVAYEIAVNQGYELALRFLGIDEVPDDPSGARIRHG